MIGNCENIQKTGDKHTKILLLVGELQPETPCATVNTKRKQFCSRMELFRVPIVITRDGVNLSEEDVGFAHSRREHASRCLSLRPQGTSAGTSGELTSCGIDSISCSDIRLVAWSRWERSKTHPSPKRNFRR